MNTERERFEGWLKGCGYIDRDLDTDHRGVYVASMVRIQWNAWQAARAWRPIAEAPKDGTVIIVAGGSFHCDEVGYEISGLPLRGFEFAEWCKYEKRFCDPENTFRFFTPTHFQALPPPPEGK